VRRDVKDEGVEKDEIVIINALLKIVPVVIL